MNKIYSLLIICVMSVSSIAAQTRRTASEFIDKSQRPVEKSHVDLKQKLSPELALKFEKKLKQALSRKNNSTGFTNLQSLKSYDSNAFNSFPARKNVVAANDDLEVLYYRPEGTYLWGFASDLSPVYYPAIVAPALRNIPLVPLSTADNTTYKWTISMSGDPFDISVWWNVSKDGTLYFDGLPNDFYPVPTVNGKSGTKTASYCYAEGISYEDEEITPFLLTSVPGAAPITNIDIWTGDLDWRITQSNYFGPGAKYNNKAQTRLLSYYTKPLAPLTVSHINLLARAMSSADSRNIIPKGKTLILSVYVFNEDESVTLAKKITIDQSNVTTLIMQTELGEDASFAWINFPLDKTLILDKEFVVELSGYDSTYDFIIPYWANPESGSVVAVYGQEQLPFFEWKLSNDGTSLTSVALDIPLQLIGEYNCFEFESVDNKLVADAAGGEAKWLDEEYGTWETGSYLYSSYPASYVKLIECPEWIEKPIRISDVDWDRYGILEITCTAKALPDGVEGRIGNIVFDSNGITSTLYVKQGNVDWPSSIQSPAANVKVTAVREGDNFRLTYPTAASSVSVFNTTGQKIGEYALPASGVFTIPASHLPNGVYVLKLNGVNASVKVVK